MRVLLLLLLVPLVAAQDVTVGIKSAPPFVMEQEDAGFSIDLMDALAKELGWQVSYSRQQDLLSHLSAVQSGSVDVGIAATTITAEREERVEFSHPFYESSLAIAIKPSTTSIWRAVLSKELLTVLGTLIAYALIVGHLYWILERGESVDMKYGRGVLSGIWWTVVTISTVGYGDISPKGARGRVFGMLVIASGIAFFGAITAILSSSLTVHQLGTSIQGPDDLHGELVAAPRGTESVAVSRSYGMRVIETGTIEEALIMVEEGRVSAAVHDTPVLQYLLQERPQLVLAPEAFSPSRYGIIFPRESPLRKEVNIALLQLEESGAYERLRRKWFG